MVHHLFTKGSFDFVHRVVDAKGTVSLNKIAGSTNQIHGMLGFIDGVDLYNKALSSKNVKGAKDPSSLTSKESMYRRFLLFKDFYAASVPVIICEGKTDNVYMLHAIRSLADKYPQLATKDTDGSIKLVVRIYKYSGTSTGRILGITGGTADLTRFTRQYDREIKRFKAPGATQPIILLVDNDSGAREKGQIFNAVKEINKTVVNGTEPFVYVTGNLYMVSTPLKLGAKESKIEDFFDDSIKSTIVGGKTFNPENEFETDTHYGKHIFAQKAIRVHADKINFSEFSAILSNVVAVIDAHAKKHPVVPPTP